MTITRKRDEGKRAKEAEAQANKKVADLQAQHKAAEVGVAAAIKANQETTTIPNTGELIAPMLEELLAAISNRVMAAIEPNARSLGPSTFESKPRVPGSCANDRKLLPASKRRSAVRCQIENTPRPTRSESALASATVATTGG